MNTTAVAPATLLIVGLALAACTASPGTGPTDGTEPPAPPAGVVLHDDFDDDRNEWGIVDNEFGTASYEAGEYVWNTTGSNIHWVAGALIPEDEGGSYGGPTLTDVTVSAELSIMSGQGVAGVFCREQADTDADFEWYEFVVRDGFAAIRRADTETNQVELVSTTELALPAGTTFTLEGTCTTLDDGTAELRLAVNGDEVLTATDADPILGGIVGQQAYTYPIHAPMTVRWNSFTVTAL